MDVVVFETPPLLEAITRIEPKAPNSLWGLGSSTQVVPSSAIGLTPLEAYGAGARLMSGTVEGEGRWWVGLRLLSEWRPKVQAGFQPQPGGALVGRSAPCSMNGDRQ